jgi:hypothetical protein
MIITLHITLRGAASDVSDVSDIEKCQKERERLRDVPTTMRPKNVCICSTTTTNAAENIFFLQIKIEEREKKK